MSLFVLCFYILVFFFSLSSVADFSNIGARVLASAWRALFTRAKGNAIRICGLNMNNGNLSMAVFYFHP